MSWDLKDYVTVAERLRLFMKRYPEGSMQLDPVEFREIEGKTWVIGRAYAYRTPDDPRPGIGTAWEIIPGMTSFTKFSEVQNVETSAWGRALAAIGIGIDKGVATWDEINRMRAEDRPKVQVTPIEPAENPFTGPLGRDKAREIMEPITEKQLNLVEKQLIPDIPEAEVIRIVTEYLGEYRPPKAWTKREAMGASRDSDGLIDLLSKAKKEAMAGTRSKGRQDDPWNTT
jgi:hypothetical protein